MSKTRLRPIRIVRNQAEVVRQETPDEPRSFIQMDDTTGGLLINRLTTAQRDAIPNPANGLLIYNIDSREFEFWNTRSWGSLAPSTGPALSGATDGDLTTLGQGAGPSDQGSNGSVFIGQGAGTSNFDGIGNTALGAQALNANSSGANNTAVGALALTLNQAGNNTAVGYRALSTNNTGTQNVGVGERAGRHITRGASNTAIGTETLFSLTDGIGNTAVGMNAGANVVHGGNNTLIGAVAGFHITGGNGNIIIGEGAGTTIATASNCIVIGTEIDVNSSSFNGQLNIGGEIRGVIGNYVGFANIVSLLADKDIRFNGPGDTGWRIGILRAGLTRSVATGNALQIITGSSSGDGFAVGSSTNSSWLEIASSDGTTLLNAIKVMMPHLPTNDPALLGQLWIDPARGHVVKVSQG